MIDLAVMGLRGATSVLVLAVLVGGLPRIAQLGIAAIAGLWSAMVVGAPTTDVTWLVALREVVLGAALGVAAAVPLLAAATAGRLVDGVAARRPAEGSYRVLFGLLAAVVFVGIDGHVTMITAIAESHARVPATLEPVQPGVLDAIARLVIAAVKLAIPWLVTAAVVEIAVGAGTRLAARSGAFVPAAAAVPAALVMMTAALISTLAIVIAAAIRGTL